MEGVIWVEEGLSMIHDANSTIWKEQGIDLVRSGVICVSFSADYTPMSGFELE